MLFGNGKTQGKPHNGGCECSGCSPHFQGIRSTVMAARKAKQAAAAAGTAAAAGARKEAAAGAAKTPAR